MNNLGKNVSSYQKFATHFASDKNFGFRFDICEVKRCKISIHKHFDSLSEDREALLTNV